MSSICHPEHGNALSARRGIQVDAYAALNASLISSISFKNERVRFQMCPLGGAIVDRSRLRRNPPPMVPLTSAIR